MSSTRYGYIDTLCGDVILPQFFNSVDEAYDWCVREYGEDAHNDRLVLIAPRPITDEQIEALRYEAGCAGDDEQVAICLRALDGDESARAECAHVIQEVQS